MAERPTPRLSLRWSEHEARKPYARPFGVGFHDAGGEGLGSIAVSGSDLVYYEQFQVAVLALAGELFRDPRVEGAPDPQRVWLDILATLMPAAPTPQVRPTSDFDPAAGRVFRFAVSSGGTAPGLIEAAQLVSYQDFQAGVAHRTGALYRDLEVEAIEDPVRRQACWVAHLGPLVVRPDPSEAMAQRWPWR